MAGDRICPKLLLPFSHNALLCCKASFMLAGQRIIRSVLIFILIQL